MIIPVILFYLFSLIAIVSSIMVITLKNPVYSVLCLILAFFNVAGLFVLLGAELLGMVLIIVYVGAVAVLFLFVVMMLNINTTRVKEGFLTYLPVGSAIAILLFIELFFVLSASSNDSYIIPTVVRGGAAITNAEAIGNVLYTDYIYLFQLSGIILLVAMIGAIVLTHRKRTDSHKQIISDQLARKVSDTIEIVKVEPGQGVS